VAEDVHSCRFLEQLEAATRDLQRWAKCHRQGRSLQPATAQWLNWRGSGVNCRIGSKARPTRVRIASRNTGPTRTCAVIDARVPAPGIVR